MGQMGFFEIHAKPSKHSNNKGATGLESFWQTLLVNIIKNILTSHTDSIPNDGFVYVIML